MQNLSVSFSIRNIFDGFNLSRKFLGEISRTKVKFPIQAEKNLEYFERDKWFGEDGVKRIENRKMHGFGRQDRNCRSPLSLDQRKSRAKTMIPRNTAIPTQMSEHSTICSFLFLFFCPVSSSIPSNMAVLLPKRLGETLPVSRWRSA